MVIVYFVPVVAEATAIIVNELRSTNIVAKILAVVNHH